MDGCATALLVISRKFATLTKYVAFLRAVNLGPHNSLKRDVLANVFTSSGCNSVSTYLQTGNIIFDTSSSPADLVPQIEAKLTAITSKEVTVILRDLADIRELAENPPFGEHTATADEPHFVTFLQTAAHRALPIPYESAKKDLLIINCKGVDIFSIGKRQNGRITFPNAIIEQKCQVRATTRNWNTVLGIASKTQK